MTDLYDHLSRLGLSQYVDQFLEEGFESWETVLHITESDLDHLKVKLGHRRILQKEIALERGIPYEQLTALASPGQAIRTDGTRSPAGAGHHAGALDKTSELAQRGKRKYRRHPKQDENAPERPPSAYVLFSNKTREELKPLNLTFTEIAKRVGERWQALTTEDKTPFESQATTAKERYHQELSTYKTTDEYRSYMEYLANFKAKNAGSSDGKRPKLETEDSGGSSGLASGMDGHDTRHGSFGTGQQRPDPTSSAVGLPSPASTTGSAFLVANASMAPLAHPAPKSSVTASSSGTYQESSTSSVRSGLPPWPAMEPHVNLSAVPLGNHRVRDPLFSSRRGSNASSYDRRQEGPAGQRPTSGTPTLVHHGTSSSSGYSSGSGLSNPSTNSSLSNPSTGPSLYSLKSHEEEPRPHLPPLSAAPVRSSGPSLADYSLRKSQTPESIPQSNIPPPLQPQYSPPSSVTSDGPPRTSFRNLTIQQGPSANDARLPAHLAQIRDPSVISPKKTPPTLPSIRTAPTLSSSLPSGHDGRDRLSLLAEVAQSDPDLRPRPPP